MAQAEALSSFGYPIRIAEGPQRNRRAKISAQKRSMEPRMAAKAKKQKPGKERSNPAITIGIIGGSGLYSMTGLTDTREIRVKTPFGDPSDAIVTGTLEGKQVAFLARHGRGHRILPSEINFRANIYAHETTGRRARHLGQRGRLVARGSAARRISRPRSVCRPHQAPHFHVFRGRAGGPRDIRQADLRAGLRRSGRRERALRREGSPPWYLRVHRRTAVFDAGRSPRAPAAASSKSSG